MMSALTLKDRIVFITGSTRGIGWSIAKVCAQHGATVLLNGRKESPALTDNAALLKKEYGVHSEALIGDMSNAEDVSRIYQHIFRTYKRLDVLVNNAGILEDQLLGMVSKDMVERVFATNTFGVIYNLQAAARLMQRNKSGSIINMSSIIGVTGNVGQVVYGGSKAAVIGITKSAAKELAPFNIRVNAIAPGFIDTDMVRQLSEVKFKERLDSIKMNRIGSPDDVANSVLFLASDLSSYMTGQVLGVDGGMLI
jgi:3-oxoacyl-[acyl-carrier protein] reductase